MDKDRRLFNSKDKYFFIADLLFTILLVIILGIIGFVSIVLIGVGAIIEGVVLLFLGICLSVIAFVFFKLLMSLLLDIKFIRNKLYEIDNGDLVNRGKKE